MRSFRSLLFIRVVGALAAAVLVGAACAPGGQPAGPAGESPTPGGRLVLGSISDVKTLQPVISTDTSSSLAWGWVYLSLSRTNYKTGEIEPNLAEKIELSQDGLTLTYTLRDNLVWSDGAPFTGEDYKYTAESVMRSKKTVRKSTFLNVVGAKDFEDGKASEISGIQVSEGGKKISIKFSKVFCPAIAQMGGAGAGGILPKHSFVSSYDPERDKDKNIDDHPLNLSPPASMGPFVFKDFKPGDRITYTRNEKFFRGAPLVDELVIKVYADATAAKAALVTGEVTYYSIEAKDFDEVSRVDTLQSYVYPSQIYNYIGWNAAAAKAPWLADKRVRQALWYGINTDAIIQKIVFGKGRRVFAHSLPVQWSYNDAELNKYPYDPSKAKQLLEQAGAKMGSDGIYRWTNGQPMKMRIETNQGSNVRETILQFAQEQYRQIGIQIDPLLESFPALLDRTDPGTDFEGFIIGWSLGADPDPYSIWHSSQRGKNQFNDVDYNNPRVDKALEDNRNGPDCGRSARSKALQTVDKELNEDAPYTFLYSADILLFAQKSLQGLDPFTWSITHNSEQWWIKR